MSESKKDNLSEQKFSDSAQRWTAAYTSRNMAYPAEYVIRIFKGEYPKLNFDKSLYPNQKILDIGCGDGRNLAMLRKCGFSCCGVEITDEIVNQVTKSLSWMDGISIKTGHNENLPFENGYFDYVLSWNSCYYMGERLDFKAHVKEFARVLKPQGTLVLSIPKKTCFLYHGSEIFEAEDKEKYAIIRNDPFNIRNGTTLKIFDDEGEISESFSPEFDSFIFASIHDDCFGYDYHWHLVICKKEAW